jgi:hypothetical protein
VNTHTVVLNLIFIDHGTELLTAEVKAWCAANKLNLPGSAYYAHSSHGKIERLNLIIGNALRCALLEEGVLPQEWPWILILAMRIRNSLPTQNHPLTTPWELYFKRNPTNLFQHLASELESLAVNIRSFRT